MVKCWREDPILRPNFQSIVHTLKTLGAGNPAAPATSQPSSRPAPPPYSEAARYRAVETSGRNLMMNNSMSVGYEAGGSTGRAGSRVAERKPTGNRGASTVESARTDATSTYADSFRRALV